MATLEYNFPPAKTAEYVSDYEHIHHNTETDENGDPKYTDAQWVREHILRGIRRQIVRGKDAKARDALAENNADDIT